MAMHSKATFALFDFFHAMPLIGVDVSEERQLSFKDQMRYRHDVRRVIIRLAELQTA